MTRDQYLEMCEMMNSAPKDSEIPLEFSDLVLEAQEVLQIYNILQDQWDYMGGNYIGKNYTYIDAVFQIYNVDLELRKTYLELLVVIDNTRQKQIQDSKPKDNKAR